MSRIWVSGGYHIYIEREREREIYIYIVGVLS